MRARFYRLTEPVRVELRVGHRVIERAYDAGLVATTDDDDRIALDRLVDLGLASRAADVKRKRAATRKGHKK